MNQEREPVPTEGTRQEERAARILEAAAALVLRYGYKRVTVEDIARRADVGKGTIYLHWKTRDALFTTLLLREALAIWGAQLERIRADPEEVLLSRVMRSLLLTGMKRPLARALFTRDRELLGKLAESRIGGAVRSERLIASHEFLNLLRSQGLIRSDDDLNAQAYTLRAVVNGFLLVEPAPGDEEPLSLEERADLLAETIHRVFEPQTLPPRDALRDVAATMIRWFEQVYANYEQRIRAEMGLR